MTPRRELYLLAGLLILAFAPGLLGLAGRTLELTGYYDHLLFVPALAVWIAWRTWPVLEGQPSRWGFPPLIIGLWTNACGRAEGVLFPQVLGLVLTLVAAALLRLGLRGAWELRFPLAFMLLALPIPRQVIDQATGWLRRAVTLAAVEVMALVDVPAVAQGTTILLSSGRAQVEEACSGLQGALGYLVFGVFLARSQPGAGRALLVVAASLPAAFLGNLTRVLLLIFLATHWPRVAGHGLAHVAVGLAVYGVGFGLLLGVQALIHEDATATPPSSPPAIDVPRFASGTIPALVLGAGVGCVAGLTGVRPPTVEDLPLEAGSWHGTKVELPRPVPGARYVRYMLVDQPHVDLYVIRGLGSQLDVHLPSACFPGQGFAVLEAERVLLGLSDRQVSAIREVYGRGSERYVTIHWYRLVDRDDPAPDFVRLKLDAWLRRMSLRPPQPIALIRFTTPLDPRASSRVQSVASEVLPRLPATEVALPGRGG